VLHLRVFVSSPGDVGAERGVALAVAERLQFEFRGHIKLDTYLWERSLLRATDTFQAQIVDIRDADLALFILWARMGTPLPLSEFSRPDGSQYASGTEYEFERAREGYEEKQSPEILCYLKTAEVSLSMKDRELRAQQVAELDAVSTFVDGWFRNADGTYKSAFYNFEKTVQFEELLEIHMRDWIRERLKAAEIAETTQGQWKGSPFRGLEAFNFEHALIYCGRTGMVSELLDALRRRGAAGRGFLMVTGMSGVGKSSLVRAGLLPILMRPRVIEHVIAWRRAEFKPSGGLTLLGGLASALLQGEALPGLAESAAGLEQLLRDPPALTMAITRALEAIRQKQDIANPVHDPKGMAHLVVVCDQFEEIFGEQVSAADRIDFCEALRTMILTGQVWVIATLRADFFSRCSELPERFRDLFVERGGMFTVGGPRPAEIAQMIRRPAVMAGLRFERRGDPEEGLDDVLRDAASGNPTVLPLLEFTLDELWRRSASSGVLRFSDYEDLGGLHGALKIRADEEFARLPVAVQAALPKVLAALVHSDPADERLILQSRVSLTQFAKSPQSMALISAFVGAHLLVGDQGADGTPVIGLAHEALLREWPPALQWIEQSREMLRLRAGIAAAAALWRNAGYAESHLMTGALLKDATRLMAASADMLAPEERRFIESSLAEARRKRLQTIRRGAAAAALIMLAILLPIIGFQQITYDFAFARSVPKVWNGERDAPLSTNALANLQADIDVLSTALRAQVAGRGHRPELNPWSVAQIWTALHGLDPILMETGPRLREFMSTNRDPLCQCWRETEDKLPHTLATAWVIYSLAHYGQPATREEIEFLVKRQGETGWWPMFPATNDEANASTSATAWVTLALHHQLEKNLVAADQRGAVSAAIQKSTAWLTRRVVANKARWTEYPPDQTFERTLDYLAASGLVMHTLHVVDGARTFDPLWLDQLPQRVPGPLENEVAKGYVFRSKTQFTLDDVRHYEFPWMLRATAESYGSGTTLQRTRALIWLEQAFQSPMRLEDFRAEFWTMAETLFALRQAQALLDPKAGKDAVSQR
jgi:conflict system STAND superfamily ATPase